MNIVIIEPTGELRHGKNLVSGDPTPRLNHQIELAPGFTLRSFFRLLDCFPSLGRINEFYSSLRRQYDACPSEGCEWGEFSCLEFSKTVEMIGFPSNPRLEIYNSLKGVQEDKRTEIRFLLLENLLDLPIRLGNLKHVVFGDKMDVFEFETVYTLFEFVDGIVWELSFQTTSNQCSIRR